MRAMDVLGEHESSRRTAAVNSHEAVPLRRPLILVVEDDRHEWELYGKLLWYNGFDVIRAETGEEGLVMARRHLPDLLLLDLLLPGMDGMSVCRTLKSDPATRNIIVVVLSGRAECEYGVLMRRNGCARYLEKPIGPLRVLHEVEQLIGRAPPS